MVDLIAETPCGARLPLTHGGVTLREVACDHLLSVAPFDGCHGAVSQAIESVLGHGLPEVGESAHHGRLIWYSHGVWLVFADLPDLPGAAVTDQASGHAIVEIEGAGVRDVLARLCPLDLRPARFGDGASHRSLIGHVIVHITRIGETFRLMAPRSMAGTLIEDLSRAMRNVTARAQL